MNFVKKMIKELQKQYREKEAREKEAKLLSSSRAVRSAGNETN